MKKTNLSANTGVIATATPVFHLANAASTDWRENLGVTPARADEIIALITKAVTGDSMAPAMEVIGNLPLENERLFGAWAIGHGAGQSDNETENPLADLFAGGEPDEENGGLGDNFPDADQV